MSSSKYLAAVSLFGTLTLSAPVWADIPPDDVCLESDEGKACENAIVANSEATRPGTCQKTQCTRATPDGPMTYECHRCVADEDGAGGQANEGGRSSSAGSENNGGKASGGSASGSTTGGKPAGTAGTPPNPPEDDDTDSEEGSCSVSQAPGSAGALGSGLFVLGLALAGIVRRRSQAS